MILYLLSSSYEDGRSYALSHGWIQVGFNRFGMEDASGRHDIRLVRHLSDMPPTPYGIYVIHTPNIEGHPQFDRLLALISTRGASWYDA